MKSKLLSFLLFGFMIMSFMSCSDDEPANISVENATIWTGVKLSFSKANNADPLLTENQDMITSDVILTRGNSGGQIFNIAVETASDKSDSPRGTFWAVGTTANLESLEFRKFRAAVESPKDVVGQDLVLYLENEDVLIDIKFDSWSSDMGGGFSYTRATE